MDVRHRRSGAIRRGVVLALAATVLSAVAMSAAAAVHPHHQGRVATGAVAPAPTPTARQQFGVTMPDVPWSLDPLTSLTSSLGRRPDLVMWYAAWSDRASFPATQAGQVAATGATPVVTWEPWDPAAGVDQPAYRLSRIASGKHDSYVGMWARQVRSYGKPLVIRFGHEMNGSWYPWSAQANGNTPADYVAAFRHVRAVFVKAGATNAAWSWSPNVPYDGSVPLAQVYPGDAHVDRVALDGYNWSTLQPASTWTSFWDVMSEGVSQVRAITAEPLFIGETASPELGGDKAAWIGGLFATLADHPEIRGFTWFHFDKETDWRIDSSAASLDAFRTGLASY